MALKQVAQLNYLRMTPRKVRSVGDLVKGMSVNAAEAQLMYQSRRAAKPLLKLLRSAVANAKNNQKADVSKLFIESLRVDQGPMLKRFLPRARGMATPIQKKMCHVTLILAEKEGLKPRFNIVVPKKVKLPPEAKSGKKKDKHDDTLDKPKVDAKHKGGFFQKVFTRKSNMGV